jgi:hypothetical protein
VGMAVEGVGDEVRPEQLQTPHLRDSQEARVVGVLPGHPEERTAESGAGTPEGRGGRRLNAYSTFIAWLELAPWRTNLVP